MTVKIHSHAVSSIVCFSSASLDPLRRRMRCACCWGGGLGFCPARYRSAFLPALPVAAPVQKKYVYLYIYIYIIIYIYIYIPTRRRQQARGCLASHGPVGWDGRQRKLTERQKVNRGVVLQNKTDKRKLSGV